MANRLSDLRSKEIINIHDGMRFGAPGDLEFDLVSGRVTALIVPGPYKLLGLFGRGEDVRIPWEAIRKIGEDIILVDYATGIVPPQEKKEGSISFSL